MIVAALVLPETTVGMIEASATHSPAQPVHAQCGVDNSHGVADKKFKAAERKFKALFAPPRAAGWVESGRAHGR